MRSDSQAWLSNCQPVTSGGCREWRLKVLEFSPSCRDGLTDSLRSHLHPGGIIACESRKFIYMKPCRTGGTSLLREFLERRVPGIVHHKDHPRRFHEWLAGITDQCLAEYFIFSAVRNPWDRAVSIATYFRTPVAKFVQDLTQHSLNRTMREHSLPLYHYTHMRGLPFVDQVCQFETLAEDVSRICGRIGVPAEPLPHVNRTDHPHYRECLTPDESTIVANEYAEDIALYGYQF